MFPPPCPPLPRHPGSTLGFEPWASRLGGQEPSRGSDYPAIAGPENASEVLVAQLAGRARPEQLCSNQWPASRLTTDLHRKLEKHNGNYCFSAKDLLRPSNVIPNNN